MPPSSIHFNGSVNLPDAETTFREMAKRVGSRAHAYTDGETGDRGNWIFFQLERFRDAIGLTDVEPREFMGDPFPQVGLDGTGRPVAFGNLGYADVYFRSYAKFLELRRAGIVPAYMKLQVEYPSPIAPVSVFVRPEDQAAVQPAYTAALMRDLGLLLAAVGHAAEDIVVQWDIAAEFGLLENWYGLPPELLPSPEQVAADVARYVDQVPRDVEAALHLCYGDYKHAHASEPTSLRTQVELVNRINARASHLLNRVAFTVPQYQDDPAYFEPLRSLRLRHGTVPYFALVPYHPDQQAPGTTSRQVAFIDENLAYHPTYGQQEWGICTECGMGRCQPSEIPQLLDLHAQIVDTYRY